MLLPSVMRVRRLSAVLVLLALLLTVPAGAAKPIAHREVLPNGIVLLVAERPAVPIVVVRAFAQAGAVLDPPGGAGLANLTGALLTRGTAKHTGPELDSLIEFVGGSLGAGAGRDGLTASLAVLKKDVGLGLDLLAEVLLTPTFPPEEVKRKTAQIQAAIKRSEEDPGTVASRALVKLVFPGHPYGVPVEGTLESVGKLTRADVVRFHATPGGPPRDETVEKALTQATIVLGRQAIRQTDPDYFPLTVASYVLGGGSASRLYSRVREEGGLAYAVYSYVNPARYGASFIVSAQTRTAQVPKVIEIVREELTRMTREPVTERELKLAKEYLIGSFPLRLDTSSKVADFVVAIEQQGLGLDYADRYKERVAKVTPADVQRVAAKYFAPDTFDRVVVGAPKP
jgi:zinc protease